MAEATKTKQRRRLEKLVSPQINSFNWFLEEGKDLALADLEPAEFEHTPQKKASTDDGEEEEVQGKGSVRCILELESLEVSIFLNQIRLDR
jgi:hypothetical protein